MSEQFTQTVKQTPVLPEQELAAQPIYEQQSVQTSSFMDRFRSKRAAKMLSVLALAGGGSGVMASAGAANQAPDDPNYPRAIAAQECFRSAFSTGSAIDWPFDDSGRTAIDNYKTIIHKKGSQNLQIRLQVISEAVHNQANDAYGPTCDSMDGGRSISLQTYVQNDKGQMKPVGKPAPVIENSDAAFKKWVTLPVGNLKRMGLCTLITRSPYKNYGQKVGRKDIQVREVERAHYNSEQKQKKWTLEDGSDLGGFDELCPPAKPSKASTHTKHTKRHK